MAKIFGMSVLGAVVFTTFVVFGSAQQSPIARIADVGPLATGVALAGDGPAECGVDDCEPTAAID